MEAAHMNALGDGTGGSTIVCNTPNQRITKPLQQGDFELGPTGPCGQACCPGSGRCGQGYSSGREVHCHTPASPCCSRNVHTPGHAQLVSDHDEHSVSRPNSGQTQYAEGHRRKSSCEESRLLETDKGHSLFNQVPTTSGGPEFSAPSETLVKDLKVHTPHSLHVEQCNPHTLHSVCTPSASPVEAKSKPDNLDFAAKNDMESRTAPQENERCAETSPQSPGIERSADLGLNSDLESYAQQRFEEMKQDVRTSQPFIDESLSQKSKSDQSALNHLSFKEKQLVMSAVGKAASNVACANMLQEKDKTNSGFIGRRDFQAVMDKFGVLKNMSSREVDAVFKGFRGTSETELDYNKFICACNAHVSKLNNTKK